MDGTDDKMDVNFHELKWDTDYFGIKCAKAIMYSPVTVDVWNELKKNFQKYDFISIENKNLEPSNTRLIAKDTNAFHADINVQFSKTTKQINEVSDTVHIEKNMKKDDRIIEMAYFKFSKFIEDPGFAQRGGENVYRQWVINSFEKPDKFFAVSEDENGKYNGFILFSYIGKTSRIELFSVAKECIGKGIARNLFDAYEKEANNNGCDKIIVGTMIRNIDAINFYRHMGFKLDGCNQVYHLWNI